MAAGLPHRMTAWTQDRYGGPEVLSRRSLEVPSPGRGEVLLRVRATALNAGDVRIMRGDPLLVRPFFGFRRPRIPVRGMDVAGTVVGIGPGADGLAIGDEVVGELRGGGLAEYALAPVARLTRRPEQVTPSDAATLPIAGGTAWQALDLAGAVADGRVLVIGASGGVGSFAVQLAVVRGAEVHALCGARSADLVSALGARRVFDYRAVTPSDLGAGDYDAVVDIVGSAPLADLQRLLRPGGTAVLVSGAGGRILGPIPRMIGAAIRSRRSRRIRPLAASPSTARTASLLELVAAGRVRPVIERTASLDEAGEALAHADSGRALGKVVVMP